MVTWGGYQILALLPIYGFYAWREKKYSILPGLFLIMFGTLWGLKYYAPFSEVVYGCFGVFYLAMCAYKNWTKSRAHLALYVVIFLSTIANMNGGHPWTPFLIYACSSVLLFSSAVRTSDDYGLGVWLIVLSHLYARVHVHEAIYTAAYLLCIVIAVLAWKMYRNQMHVQDICYGIMVVFLDMGHDTTGIFMLLPWLATYRPIRATNRMPMCYGAVLAAILLGVIYPVDSHVLDPFGMRICTLIAVFAFLDVVGVFRNTYKGFPLIHPALLLLPSGVAVVELVFELLLA